MLVGRDLVFRRDSGYFRPVVSIFVEMNCAIFTRYHGRRCLWRRRRRCGWRFNLLGRFSGTETKLQALAGNRGDIS